MHRSRCLVLWITTNWATLDARLDARVDAMATVVWARALCSCLMM
jgi:hypothetical protein